MPVGGDWCRDLRCPRLFGRRVGPLDLSGCFALESESAELDSSLACELQLIELETAVAADRTESNKLDRAVCAHPDFDLNDFDVSTIAALNTESPTQFQILELKIGIAQQEVDVNAGIKMAYEVEEYLAKAPDELLQVEDDDDLVDCGSQSSIEIGNHHQDWLAVYGLLGIDLEIEEAIRQSKQADLSTVSLQSSPKFHADLGAEELEATCSPGHRALQRRCAVGWQREGALDAQRESGILVWYAEAQSVDIELPSR